MMSSTGQQKRTLIQAAKHVWTLGGFRAYYRGLSVGKIIPLILDPSDSLFHS